MRRWARPAAALGLLAGLWPVGADARGRLAQGGVFARDDLVGCAEPRDALALAAPASAGRAAPGETVDRLVRSGACARFRLGEPYTIEEERGDLVCLRPQDERDCAWSSRSGIAE